MALQLFQEMRTYGIEPNIISYNATISACEKGVQWGKAIHLFKDMEINGIDPNIISTVKLSGHVLIAASTKRPSSSFKKANQMVIFQKFRNRYQARGTFMCYHCQYLV